MFSYTCTQSCCNLPNNPHNGKTIQSNALLVISIFMMLNMEGKRKYFRQVSTLLLYDMIFARSFNNSFVYYFGNLSYEYKRIKTKAFCSICSRSNIMYILRVLINDLENVMRNTFQLLYSYRTEFDTGIYRCWNEN